MVRFAVDRLPSGAVIPRFSCLLRMFRPVDSNVHFPTLETEILKLWDERQIYEKSLAQREGAPKFIFYEGPPTANGLPHPGHCLTRAIKDLFPRYRTMRGYRCDRKAGWDTHGLPVEVEVCKDIGIHAKEEIEAYGVEPFIHRCQESVWRYMQQWEHLTRRLGFWIHLDEAYVTYHQSYVESVWWALKKLWDRGLLYQGHKIVWWWAQGGTALSSGEVGQGYRQVADPSVYVRFPLLDDAGQETDTDLLVWTTTPWTLPSNQFAAVHPQLTYAVVKDEELGRKLIIAADLVETIAGKVKRELTVLETCQGTKLLGRRYVPPFDCYYRSLGQIRGKLAADGQQFVAWRVTSADFVTTESGTGVVHEAPAFGEVDYDLLVAEQSRFQPGAGPQLINAVAPDGKFTDEAPEFCRGRWVKDCDKDIARNLKERGLLYHQEQYLHDYPFCWRAENDPLIQYPRKSWFIKTLQFKQAMLANNAKINWLPEHIKAGRFGNFLETNVDWALSRERYWGTPLPIWVCEQTGEMAAVASYEELLSQPGVQGTEVWEKAKQQNPELVDDLKVHKPYIDEITFASPFADGARMRRVTEVIDCWFDSGAMPFAQWGYPHQGERQFEDQFPADFISEALDQTRGWFYSLLAISTLLFGEEASEPSQRSELAQEIARVVEEEADPHAFEPKVHSYPHPYKNCIVLGLMLGEDGQKMSKSKRNYREPNEIFDRYGADALRWYFFANQAPWTSIRYSEQAIKDSIPEFLLRLWNVYNFLIGYATSDDRWNPADEIPGSAGQLATDVLATAPSFRPAKERSELDRWILSELAQTCRTVVARMDAYDNFAAAGAIKNFVDVLSNWYVRRSRDRFWASGGSVDKSDAYWTLYECLVTTTKLIAPFTPFLAEALWQNLAVAPLADRVVESVHLCDYPTGDEAIIAPQLSQRMEQLREITSLGRAARMEARLKVRQPLSKVEVILAEPTHQAWLAEHAALIREELNVKQVEFTREADEYISYTVLPNLPKLGPRLGKQLPALRKALGAADPAALLKQLNEQGQVALDLGGDSVNLDAEDVQVRLQAKEGWAAAQGRSCVVVLSTELTDELVAEGIARDVIRAIQDRRKGIGCQLSDRIEIGLEADDATLAAAVDRFRDHIQGETLAQSLELKKLPGVEGLETKAGDTPLVLYVRKV